MKKKERMNGEYGNCVECGKEVFFTITGKHCDDCWNALNILRGYVE
tara:strand:- start:194 stop:331 length:138 start_codon:yes stop_codon:yes gene_type:complete